MASQFAIGLRLGDLNDFIAPSQACVRPVGSDASTSAAPAAEQHVELQADGTYATVQADGTHTELEAARVTLNDCLACSGCITSAESVLVAAQSTAEFFTRLASKPALFAVSLAPQSVASLAAHYNLSLLATFRKLVTLFTNLGANCVTDTAFTNDMVLLELAHEVIEKKARKEKMPVLFSECPGWVCYAEKTQQHALAHMSHCKSAMGLMGVLVKTRLAAQRGVTPAACYHVGVMPCYDKKLEASRDDLRLASVAGDVAQATTAQEQRPGVALVDTVLATTEVVEIIQKIACDFVALPEAELVGNDVVQYVCYDADRQALTGCGTSGSPLLEGVLRSAALFTSGTTLDETQVVYKQVARNQDMMEASLEGAGMKAAFAYGFRNIQNVMRKLKTHLTYDLVEVMACPQSCMNGGGQMRPGPGVKPDVFSAAVHSKASERLQRVPCANAAACALLDELRAAPDADMLLHTAYHFREDKAKNPLAIQW